MKIEKSPPFLVDRCLLVRVYTDAGIIGTGEAGLWAHHELVYAAINQLREHFVGKDASTIEHHFQTVSRDTHFQGAELSAAMSAIDIALWDILGKSLGQPASLPIVGRQAPRQGEGVRKRRRVHSGRARQAGCRIRVPRLRLVADHPVL